MRAHFWQPFFLQGGVTVVFSSLMVSTWITVLLIIANWRAPHHAVEVRVTFQIPYGRDNRCWVILGRLVFWGLSACSSSNYRALILQIDSSWYISKNTCNQNHSIPTITIQPSNELLEISPIVASPGVFAREAGLDDRKRAYHNTFIIIWGKIQSFQIEAIVHRIVSFKYYTRVGGSGYLAALHLSC